MICEGYGGQQESHDPDGALRWAKKKQIQGEVDCHIVTAECRYSRFLAGWAAALCVN